MHFIPHRGHDRESTLNRTGVNERLDWSLWGITLLKHYALINVLNIGKVLLRRYQKCTLYKRTQCILSKLTWKKVTNVLVVDEIFSSKSTPRSLGIDEYYASNRLCIIPTMTWSCCGKYGPKYSPLTVLTDNKCYACSHYEVSLSNTHLARSRFDNHPPPPTTGSGLQVIGSASTRMESAVQVFAKIVNHSRTKTTKPQIDVAHTIYLHNTIGCPINITKALATSCKIAIAKYDFCWPLKCIVVRPALTRVNIW